MTRAEVVRKRFSKGTSLAEALHEMPFTKERVAEGALHTSRDEEGAALYGAFVRKVVAAKLRDPESARFTNVIAYKTGENLTFCGSVNAKNGLGGYTGPKPFILSDAGFFADQSATADRVFQQCQGATTTFVGDF